MTTIVDDLPNFSVDGATYRASDDRVYIIVDSPNQLLALDSQDMLMTVVDLPSIPLGITVAPSDFGEFGDHIIVTSENGMVLAIDPSDASLESFAQMSTPSAAAFGTDGTLYVAQPIAGQISTVTPAGTVTTFASNLDGVDGLAVDSDGSRLFIAQSNLGRIDTLSLPDAVVTPGPMVQLEPGYAASGLVVDASDHVIVKASVNDNAVIDAFDAP